MTFCSHWNSADPGLNTQGYCLVTYLRHKGTKFLSLLKYKCQTKDMLDTACWNTTIASYEKKGWFRDAERSAWADASKGLVSCNSMLGGYTNNEEMGLA